MKKFLFTLGMGLIIGMVHINSAEAQVRVSINIDIQPAWGPYGYEYAEFYYIPEINIYYDVINRMFYFPNNGRWVRSIYLPMEYCYYDFYSLYKVVLNGVYNPWHYNRRHRQVYAKYWHHYTQVPIYCVREPRYHRARNNYHGWVEERYMPRNNGRPRSRDFSANTRNGRVSDEMRSPHVRSTNPRSNDWDVHTTPRSAGLRNDRESADYNNTRATNPRSTGDRVSDNASRGSASRRSGESVNSTNTDNRQVQRLDSRGSSSTGRTSGLIESPSSQRTSGYSSDNQSSSRGSSSVNSRSSTTRSSESNTRSGSSSRSSDSRSVRSAESRNNSASRSESTRSR